MAHRSGTADRGTAGSDQRTEFCPSGPVRQRERRSGEFSGRIPAGGGARIRRLEGTDEGVPLFADALDILFSADVPVIVELKSVPRSRRDALCSAVLAELDRRDGRFCVESFDPMIVRWFRRNAPDILRGQLTAQREELDLDAFRAYAGSHVLCNFLGRPQFIAHRVGKKALAVRASEAMGAMRVCWTAHDRSREAENDAVIFENYRPPVRFHET